MAKLVPNNVIFLQHTLSSIKCAIRIIKLECAIFASLARQMDAASEEGIDAKSDAPSKSISPSADAALAKSHEPLLKSAKVSTVIRSASQCAFGKRLRKDTAASRSVGMRAKMP